MYHKVYAPDGTMFEVIHEKWSDLILNHGWSKTPPEAVVEEVKVEEKPSRRRVLKHHLEPEPDAPETEES